MADNGIGTVGLRRTRQVIDRARLEDEQRIAAEEKGVEGGEEIQTQTAEESDNLAPEEVVLDQPQEVEEAERDAGEMPAPGKPFRSKRKERIFRPLAQPLPRPDAALSTQERKLIVKLLLTTLRHDLRAMHKTLKTKFRITAFRQV